MRRAGAKVRAAGLVCLAGIVVLAGCGDDDDGPPPAPVWREAYFETGGSYGSTPDGMLLTRTDGSFDVLNGGLVLPAGSYAVAGASFSGWVSGDAAGGTRVRGALLEPVSVMRETWWRGIGLPETRSTDLLRATTMPLSGAFDGTGTLGGKAIPAGAGPAFALFRNGGIAVVAPEGAEQFMLMLADGCEMDVGTFAVPADTSMWCAWAADGSASIFFVDSGTVEVTSYTAASFAGTFDLTVGGETLSGSFDVPTSLYGKTPGPDSYDHDDAWYAAKEIAVDGAPQSRTIDFLKDDDWIWFAATAGTTYRLRTSAHSYDDGFLWAFDRDGVTVWVDGYSLWLKIYDTDGATPLGPQWDPWETLFTAPADGIYFVRVAGDPGSYAIEALSQTGVSADAFEAAGDDSSADAEAIAVDAPAQAHTLHTFTDEDWVSFGATAGVAYYVRTTGGGDPAPRVALYHTNGVTELAAGDGFVAWVAPASGTYFVQVTGEPGAYDVQVTTTSGVAPDDYEPDDVSGQASAIAPDGAPQSRTRHSALDEEWIAVDAVAGNTYYVTTAPPAPAHFNWSFSWYDTDGTTEISPFSDFYCPASGTYYARLPAMATDYVGPYTVAVVTHSEYALPDDYEPDDGPAEATPFDTAGLPQGHTLHSSSDADWIAVDVPAGGMTITVDVLSDTGLLGKPMVSIVDTDGMTVVASGFGGATWVAGAAGTYYVAVHSFESWYYVDIEVQ
ncbi:MAG: hypothetical protein ACYTKD_15740 [Planctomycetota bacterium]|jgi:hypothetical protein